MGHQNLRSAEQNSKSGSALDTEVKLRLNPVFKGKKRAANIIGIGVWLVSLIYFWSWWFSPEHVNSIPRFILVSTLLIFVTLIPAYFVFIFSGALIPAGSGTQIPGRIAMIVTKVPSEPFSIVKNTLKAMLSQKGYSYDTWLADEDPSEETLNWCQTHGVKVSSRRGVVDYHREIWPRRTRCKEGNLAYFYDHYGYENYDYVCQFDADHVPDKEYLTEIMSAFADPSVGYVSAPSICDINATKSWSTRGRLYIEASLHGSLQTGYNNGWAPLCIGSHYAVRTAALKQIGGLGPELAEDHSTTLMMNSAGWKGIHAVNAIAHGEGPVTFADLAVQEFQWSRSLVTILLLYSPTYVPKLGLKLKFQFLFSQVWYPLFSTLMLTMFVLPTVALLTRRNFVNVTYFDFLAHSLPISIVLLILAFWWRSTGTFKPSDAKIISWEGLLFMFARWPWSLFGSFMAIRDWATGSFVDFRITPKVPTMAEQLPFRFLAPYGLMSIASSVPAIWVSDAGTASGFYLFSIANAVIYGIVFTVIYIRHAIENDLSLVSRSFKSLLQVFTIAVVLILPCVAIYFHGPEGLQAFNVGIEKFTLTKSIHRISGAGSGSVRKPVIIFSPKWNSTNNQNFGRGLGRK